MSLPKPYYQEDGVTLYNARCEDVLPHLEADSIDLIATDPPYFRVKDEAWDRAWKSADSFIEWLGEIAGEWERILKPNGSLYCFASPRLSGRTESMLGTRFSTLNHIVWRKLFPHHGAGGPETPARCSVGSLRRFYDQTERIIFAEQYGDRYAPLRNYLMAARNEAGLSTFDLDKAWQEERGTKGRMAKHWFVMSQWELPTKSHFDFLKRCGLRFNRSYEDLRREYEELRRPFHANGTGHSTDVWSFPTVSPYPGKHPCEKPLAMMEHIVKTSSRPNATVLDCFAGSGTTLLAARALGRKAIGIEMNEAYCQAIVNRLSQNTLAMEA